MPRPAGSASPFETHLWDNGTDPVAELQQTMAIRKMVLGLISDPNKIPDGTAFGQAGRIVGSRLHVPFTATRLEGSFQGTWGSELCIHGEEVDQTGKGNQIMPREKS